MGTFRDLLIWQRSVDLVTEIYRITRNFPAEEIYGLTAQIRRCSISVPSNIAEGYGRSGIKDNLKFLNFSLSSIFEMQTQLQIAFNLNFSDQTQFNSAFAESIEIEKMLKAYIRTITPKS